MLSDKKPNADMKIYKTPVKLHRQSDSEYSNIAIW